MIGKKKGNRVRLIGSIIIGVIFILAAVFFASDHDRGIQKYDAIGTITGLYTEGGDTVYKVAFTGPDGQTVHASSIYYKITNNKYKTGDPVKIRYYNLNGNRARCEIVDNALVPVKKTLKRYVIIFGGIGIVLITLGVYLLVKQIIG